MLKTLFFIILLFVVYHGLKTFLLDRKNHITDHMNRSHDKFKQIIKDLEKTKTQLTTKENHKMAEELDNYFRDHYPLIA